MRFPVIPLIFVLLLAITGAVIVPSFLQILPEKHVLVDRLNAQSGLQFSVNGAVRLRVLPRPQIIFNDITLNEAAVSEQKLQAEKLIVNLSIMDFIRNEIAVQGVYLLRADAHILLGNGLGGLIDRLTKTAHPRIDFLDSQFTVQGLDRHDGARAVTIKQMAVNLPARRRDDDLQVQIRQARAGHPEVVFSGRLGNIGASRQDLSISLRFAANEQMSFTGFLSQNSNDWRADGEMRLTSEAMVSQLAEVHLPLSLAQAARRVAFSGLVQFDKTGARSENLDITALDTVFQSRLALDWPQSKESMPTLSGRLSTGVLNLGNLSPVSKTAVEAGSVLSDIWQAFEQQLHVALRVQATRFDIGGESGQNLLLAADWQGDSIDVQRFSLDLPFRSLLLANGKLDMGKAGPSFRGSFSTRSTDALAALLWLGNLAEIDNSGLIETLDESRLQRVSLVGDIGWSTDAFELRAVSGRLGDDRLSADVNLALTDSWRGQVDVEMERLDLADWGAVNSGADSNQSVVTALLAPLNENMGHLLRDADASRDLQVSISAETLFLGVSNLGSVTFAARITDQMLRLQKLDLSDYRGLSMQLEGRMQYDAASPYGKIAAHIAGEGTLPPTLAGLLPFAVPEASVVDYHAEWHLTAPDAADWPNAVLRGEGKLGDIETTFILQGAARQISFDEAGQRLQLTMQGAADNIARLVNLTPSYGASKNGALSLEMENQSSNIAQISAELVLDEDRLSFLGSMRRGATGRRIEGALNYDLANALPVFMPIDGEMPVPLNGSAQISSDTKTFAFSGLNAAIGSGQVTGEGVVDFASDLPKLTANIKADNLDISWLLPHYEENGWSDDDMQWPVFARADLDVELSGTNIALGQVQLDALDARVKLLDGVMEVPQIKGRLMGGEFEAALLAEGGSLTPFFSIDARLNDLDLAEFTTKLYSSNPLQTRLSGTIDLSGRGASPRAMMGSLNGSMQFDLEQGELTFVNIADFAAAASTPDFEGRAAPLLTAGAEQTTSSFERGVGLINVKEGQVEQMTMDLVFDPALSVRDGRFDGQLDFVSGNILADFVVYPTLADKMLMWRLSGAMDAPKVELNATDFDRVPPAAAVPEDIMSNAVAPNQE